MTPYAAGVHVVVVRGHRVPVVIFPHEHDCWHWVNEEPGHSENYEVLYWPFGEGEYTVCEPYTERNK